MAIAPRIAAAPPPASSSAASVSANFDRRWAAWQAKGAAHERVMRLRMAIGTPILIILAGIVFALLVR